MITLEQAQENLVRTDISEAQVTIYNEAHIHAVAQKRLEGEQAFQKIMNEFTNYVRPNVPYIDEVHNPELSENELQARLARRQVNTPSPAQQMYVRIMKSDTPGLKPAGCTLCGIACKI